MTAGPGKIDVADGAASPPLPPGPPLPRVLQTAGFLLGGARFLEACRRRYGDAVTFGTLFDERFVMVFDPELVKQVFQGSNAQLHAGEANALLGPILGERSVLLLDGAEHLRHRRLLLPAFHGAADARPTSRRCATAPTSRSTRWPVGEPFALLPQPAVADAAGDSAGRVRLRAGGGRGGAPAAAAGDGRAAGTPARAADGRRLLRGAGERRGALEFEARKRAVDEILYAEIARRREAAGPGRSATTCSRRCCWPATRRASSSPTARCATSC